MALPQVLDNITQTLINVGGDTEIGTTIPPKQVGQFRVPFVANLRLGPTTTYYGGTQFTLLFDLPQSNDSISQFNVYVFGALPNPAFPVGPFSTTISPVTIRITPNQSGLLTFFVQTQLTNGNVSVITASPSCTSPVALPQGFLNTDSFTGTAYQVNNQLGTNTIFSDATAANSTVTLPPSPINGQVIIVHKVDTTAHTVTVSGGSLNIDGAGTYVIPGGSRGSVEVVWLQTAGEWKILFTR